MNHEANAKRQTGVTRRRFVGLTVGGGAALAAGDSTILRAATAVSAENKSMFKIGGDLSVNRLGFGAMRVTGDGIWGWPKDRDEARAARGTSNHNCRVKGTREDRERVRIFREQSDIDESYLAEVLRRHDLDEKWKQLTE